MEINVPTPFVSFNLNRTRIMNPWMIHVSYWLKNKIFSLIKPLGQIEQYLTEESMQGPS